MTKVLNMLKSRSFGYAVVALLLVGSAVAAVYGFNRHFNNQIRDAQAQARALVGEHEVVGLEWPEIGRVEVRFASGQRVSVPIDTGDGAQFADYCFKRNQARREISVNFRVRVYYFDQTAIPNGLSSDDAVRMPGAYLMFHELYPEEQTSNQ